MILIISMARPEDYDNAAAAGELKRKFEKITGTPALVLHYSEVTPELVDSLPVEAIFITGSGCPWPDVDPRKLDGVHDLMMQTQIPTHGACAGHQLLGFFFNATDWRQVERLEDEYTREMRPDEAVAIDDKCPGWFLENGIFKIDIVAEDPVFDGFDAHYDDGVRYIFGHRPYAYSVWDYLRQRPHRCPEHAYFVDYGRSEQLSDANHRRGDVWDLAGRPFEPRTVLYVAIQAAAYMGCSEIVLLGCDHDYLADMTRVTNHHFYREEDGVSDVEHLSAFTTERWFEEYYFRWRQYRLMRQALAARGVTIINATAGGMLDVFSRANLAELLDAAAVGAGV